MAVTLNNMTTPVFITQSKQTALKNSRPGDLLLFEDSTRPNKVVFATVLEVESEMLIAQFDDRADTSTIPFNAPEWVNHLTVLRRYAARACAPDGVAFGPLQVEYCEDSSDAAATFRALFAGFGYQVKEVLIGNPCMVEIS